MPPAAAAYFFGPFVQFMHSFISSRSHSKRFPSLRNTPHLLPTAVSFQLAITITAVKKHVRYSCCGGLFRYYPCNIHYYIIRAYTAWSTAIIIIIGQMAMGPHRRTGTLKSNFNLYYTRHCRVNGSSNIYFFMRWNIAQLSTRSEVAIWRRWADEKLASRPTTMTTTRPAAHALHCIVAAIIGFSIIFSRCHIINAYRIIYYFYSAVLYRHW